MGLFDKFKKKEPSHEEKVDLAYRGYNADMVRMIFPGGKKQASGVIHSLAKVYGLNLESCDAKMYDNILATYSDVFIRRVITQSSDDHIVTSLQVKHGNLVKNKAVAQKALAYVKLNLNNNEFFLNSADDLTALDFVTSIITQTEKTTNKNAEAERKNLDDPEYGLVPTKPIYTQGVNGSHKYLDGLKTSLGEMLTWNRRGSMGVKGINGMIDIYDSTLPSGRPYKTVYVNMYGSANSSKIPKGFKRR